MAVKGALMARCFAVVVVFSLLGCDMPTGVERTVAVSRFPQIDCVADVLRRSKADKVVVLDGRGKVPEVTYRKDGIIGGSIQLIPKVRGQSIVRFNNNVFGARRPRAEIEATRQWLDRLYAEMRQDCGPLPPAATVKEQLLRPGS
jgi:hypothetical protein